MVLNYGGWLLILFRTEIRKYSFIMVDAILLISGTTQNKACFFYNTWINWPRY
jgi:hypothetical protein